MSTVDTAVKAFVSGGTAPNKIVRFEDGTTSARCKYISNTAICICNESHVYRDAVFM